MTLEFRDDHRVGVVDPEGILGLGVSGLFEAKYRPDPREGLEGSDVSTMEMPSSRRRGLAESLIFNRRPKNGCLTLLRVVPLDQFGPLFDAPAGSEIVAGRYLVVGRIVLIKDEGSPEELEPRVPGWPSYGAMPPPDVIRFSPR